MQKIKKCCLTNFALMPPSFPPTLSQYLSFLSTLNSLFLPPPYICLCVFLPFTPYVWCQHSLSVPHSSPPSLFSSASLFLLLTALSSVFSSPLSSSSVCDSEERGEERSEHVRSQKIPIRSGEQRGVVLLALCGVESRPEWPVPVPHLPCWPGHPGLSWSGAEQSG